MIEILIYCHNFQRRLCWVLSSLCQQVGNVPEFVVNIASMPGNGSPSTDDVINSFSKRLQFKHTVFSDRNVFAYPGLTKTRQIQESNADWFMCHSCDYVLPPTRLAAINSSIKGEYKDCDTCLSSIGNVHTTVESADAFVQETILYENNAYEKAMLLDRFDKRDSRPGGFLVFSRAAIYKKRNGIYGDSRHIKDRNLFNHGMKSRSDVPFRKQMGCEIVDWPIMVHLNHNRDKEVGYHLEEQR